MSVARLNHRVMIGAAKIGVNLLRSGNLAGYALAGGPDALIATTHITMAPKERLIPSLAVGIQCPLIEFTEYQRCTR